MISGSNFHKVCCMSKVREIIRQAGGPVAVASATSDTAKPVGVDAVFKWYHNGIPDEHWPMLIKRAGVSVDDLYKANVAVRRSRPRGNAPAAAA